MNTQSLARGLAFFSLGLGLAEIAAPRRLARLIGVDEDNDTLLQLLGLREMGAGLGIMQGNQAGFMWSRVAGDAMDLGLLAAALRSPRTNRNRAIGAIAAVAGVTALDILAGVLLSQNPTEPEWRVTRDDRSGMAREEPEAMRQRADALMAEHASGHLRASALSQNGNDLERQYETPREQIETRENAATQQFQPGD